MLLTSLKKISSIDEEIERACLRQLNSLSDDVVEVVGREIIRHQIFGLIDVWKLRGLTLHADDGDSIRVSFFDLVSLSLSLFCKKVTNFQK